jgi:hypothetical protein
MKMKSMRLGSKLMSLMAACVLIIAISANSWSGTITCPYLDGTFSLGAGTVLTGPFVMISTLTYTGTSQPGPNDIHFTVVWTIDNGGTRQVRTTNYDFNITPINDTGGHVNVPPGTTIDQSNKITYNLYKTGGDGCSKADLGVENLYLGVGGVDISVESADVQGYWTLDGEPLPTPLPQTVLLLASGLLFAAVVRKGGRSGSHYFGKE